MSFPMAARPGGLQGYSEAGNGPDFAGGNVPQQSGAQDEWMRSFFQPQTFTNLAADHAGAVDNQLYASHASNVSEISVISHVDYEFDPSVIPAGYRNAPFAYTEMPPQAFAERYEQYQPQQQQQQYQSYQQVQEYQQYKQGPDALSYNMGSMMLQEPVQQHRAPAFHAPAPVVQVAQIGISVWEQDRKFYVAGVTAGSSAEAMGLTLGDHIRKLDRVPIKSWTLERVLSKLRGTPRSRVIVRTTDKKVPVLRDCLLEEEDMLPPPQAQQYAPQSQQYAPQPQQQNGAYGGYPSQAAAPQQQYRAADQDPAFMQQAAAPAPEQTPARSSYKSMSFASGPVTPMPAAPQQPPAQYAPQQQQQQQQQRQAQPQQYQQYQQRPPQQQPQSFPPPQAYQQGYPPQPQPGQYQQGYAPQEQRYPPMQEMMGYPAYPPQQQQQGFAPQGQGGGVHMSPMQMPQEMQMQGRMQGGKEMSGVPGMQMREMNGVQQQGGMGGMPQAPSQQQAPYMVMAPQAASYQQQGAPQPVQYRAQPPKEPPTVGPWNPGAFPPNSGVAMGMGVGSSGGGSQGALTSLPAAPSSGQGMGMPSGGLAEGDPFAASDGHGGLDL